MLRNLSKELSNAHRHARDVFTVFSTSSSVVSMLELILLLVVVFPIAWFASEFYDNRKLRLSLGIAAIAMSFGVAWVVGKLDRLQSNIYFSEATKDLIQNTIIELEAGRTDEVLTGLTKLRDDFRPTYETRDDYDILVDRFTNSISENPVRHDNGDPRWSHEFSTPEIRPAFDEGG
jgi:hypothetical protein